MKLCLINHSFRYELEKLIRIFLPFEKIEFLDYADYSENTAVTEISGNNAIATLNFNLKKVKKEYEINNPEDLKEAELIVATALFDCFTLVTGYQSQWGLLTGVRPAKLYSRLCMINGEADTEKYFKEVLKVSENKISLCQETHSSEEKIIKKSNKNSFSLYVSIPFCPTRCAYCSFVSHSVESAKKLIPEYLEKLCEEIILTAEIANKNNLSLSTIYIGGGTPTSITAEQLEILMKTVKENFDVENVLEYTVEAGRPDTVTEEKLKVIKKYGATRISINPQTMNDDVLNKIGRKHSAEDTVKAFELARKTGHNNINMDLIAGLPDDTLDSFIDTCNKVLKLNPESVTVHSLSMKRSSNLNVNGILPEIEVGNIASQMVDFARDILTKSGIKPYYMYRQSKTVGNLENVGYAKVGFESLYNVYIMDETHTILACGASAVTKLREPCGDYIERIFNYKYPYEYIDRFSEIISRKEGINKFYAKYGFKD